MVSGDHSARVIEAPCTDNDPDCSSDDSGGSQGFLMIVKDSKTSEWRTGLRLRYRPKYIKFYAKALPGFVRSVDSGDEVVDDHFFGVGVQYDHPNG